MDSLSIWHWLIFIIVGLLFLGRLRRRRGHGHAGEKAPESLVPAQNAKPTSILAGYEYRANHRLSCPLSDLQRDGAWVKIQDWNGEGYDGDGVWVPKTHTFRELGIDVDEPQEGPSWSEAGTFPRSRTKPFYIAIREVMESDWAVKDKVQATRVIAATPAFQPFLAAYGGEQGLIDRAYPKFLDCLPAPQQARLALAKIGVTTPSLFETTPDSFLLSLPNVGPARLESMRRFAAQWPGEPNDERASMQSLEAGSAVEQ